MSKKPHILVVEDEVKIAVLIQQYLRLKEYESSHVTHGKDAIIAVKKQSPDSVILDVMLPDMDGIEVCKSLRQFTNIPVIMLTARIDEIDHLIGFEAGADDYVCKPFRPLELLARVKAVLSRSEKRQSETNMEVGNVRLNVNKHIVHVNDHEIKLTLNEFSLLKAFLMHPNKVFSRQELLTASHGKYTENYERTIDSHIKNLRKKLSVDAATPCCIESIYGVGYKYLY
ncbi:MAG: response regulator transcription factor [Paraglaciecola sp.]|nr:response regulator transcription factor [Paraglaciecola sp.]